MKKLLTILLFCVLILPAKASADLGRSFLLDTVSKEFTPALTQDAGKFSNVFGRKSFDLDLVSIFSTSTSGAPILAYAALGRVKVADQLQIRLGPALISRQSEKISGGFFISFEIKF